MFQDSNSLNSFLQEYWQAKPLLLRQAIPGFSDPISPEVLAGLACDESVASRIVRNSGGSWQQFPGPFVEQDFSELPEDGWTLLVQGVDQIIPEVRALLHLVSFIPKWRIDDIMVSYAVNGGGVGPHFDYYDVFIIQGSGSRRWQLGQTCDSDSLLETESGLKILRHFEVQEEWQLNPGDVLYIPPGRAHQGVSLDNSMSYSVGFRAPSATEILAGFSDELGHLLSEDLRYRDPDPFTVSSPGEISASALSSVSALISQSMDKPDILAEWFGKKMTEPRNPDFMVEPESELSTLEFSARVREQSHIRINLASRIAHILADGEMLLFADGESLNLGMPEAEKLELLEILNQPDRRLPLSLEPFLDNEHCLQALTRLYNLGTLYKE